jgi:hypothetical protein
VLETALAQWRQEVADLLKKVDDLDEDDKAYVQKTAEKVEEAARGPEVNPGRLERLLNTMSSMAPDILEVTIATLQNPLAGIGLVLQKINDRIKLERAKA